MAATAPFATAARGSCRVPHPSAAPRHLVTPSHCSPTGTSAAPAATAATAEFGGRKLAAYHCADAPTAAVTTASAPRSQRRANVAPHRSIQPRRPGAACLSRNGGCEQANGRGGGEEAGGDGFAQACRDGIEAVRARRRTDDQADGHCTRPGIQCRTVRRERATSWCCSRGRETFKQLVSEREGAGRRSTSDRCSGGTPGRNGSAKSALRRMMTRRRANVCRTRFDPGKQAGRGGRTGN